VRTPILHLRSSIGFFGAEAVVLALATETFGESWNPVVGMIRNEQDPHVELAVEAEKRGLESKVFPCGGRVDRSTVREIRSFIRERDVRILHCHGYKSNLYGYLASRGTGTKLVTTCHNWTDADWKLALYAWLDRRVMRRYETVVSVSDPLTRKLERHGIPASRIVTIANGVSVERFEAVEGAAELRDELGLADDASIVAVIGRLSPEKAQDLFLEAAARVVAERPGTRFLLVGDGPTRSELTAQAASLGIADAVVFCGNRSDIERIYAAVDLVVIPSHLEGLPVVLLESMAAGTPVVATRVGAIPTVTEEGAAAALVDPGDPAGLAAAMTRVLTDAALRGRLITAASRRVRESYSSGAMARRYEEVYQRLIADGAAHQDRAHAGVPESNAR
jgi:glycosyltransferase involved in cell wall biosynthesis